MKHTVREAAGMVGLNRKTLYKHIRQGKVSATVDHEGQQVIDTAELMRAYGALETPGDTPGATAGDTPGDTSVVVPSGLLQDMQKSINKLSETVDLLREELAASREQRLLEHKPEPEPESAPDLKAKERSRKKKHPYG